MERDIFEKITKPRSPLNVTDMLVEEKKNLMNIFAKQGLTSSTFYLRFFQKGFEEWEIIGIRECKKRFLEFIGITNQLFECTDFETNGVFYDNLKNAGKGIRSKFFAFMKIYGMSTGTVIKRFSSDDWKPWELIGIKEIIENSCVDDMKPIKPSVQHTKFILEPKEHSVKEMKNMNKIPQTVQSKKEGNGINVNVPMQYYMQLTMMKLRTGVTLKDLVLKAVIEFVERNKIE